MHVRRAGARLLLATPQLAATNVGSRPAEGHPQTNTLSVQISAQIGQWGVSSLGFCR